MPREIIEVRGPSMAYFEFVASDRELFRVEYQTLRFSFSDPIVLVYQMDQSIKIIREALSHSNGEGAAILFWRKDPPYELEPVCYDGTSEPTGMFFVRCRLGTYPLLSKSVWSRANEFPSKKYKTERDLL